MRVDFYQVPEKLVGVMLFTSQGVPVARAAESLPLGFYEGTGVEDVTGDGWPEVVLIGVGGAKTLGTVIYQYKNRRLQEIGRWTGWRLRIVNLERVPVVAYTPKQYGSLTELYVWREAEFVDVSDSFPDFYGPEVEEQKKVLQGNKALPAYLYGQACQLGARALVYGKSYAEAETLCQRTLQVVRLPSRVVPNIQGSSAQDFELERKETEMAIYETLKQIEHARRHNLSRISN